MKQQIPLVALAIATIGSIGGTRLSAIAIPWLVLSTANSPLLTGLAGLVGSLTWVLIPFGGIYAGLLTDMAGILTALGVTAALYCVAALSPAVIPRFRAIGKRPVAQPAN